MTAIFPGSFDPFTIGHLDILERGLKLFDKIIIGVGVNYSKNTLLSAEERVNQIKKSVQKIQSNELKKLDKRVEISTYEGTTADFARAHHADALLRGARTTIDFENEKTLADANRALAGIETVILIAKPELSYISSTLIRDLLSHGKDVSSLIP